MELDDSQVAAKAAESSVRKEASLGRKILNGLGYAAVFAAILFFVAPESWWQFGVSPAATRKVASSVRATGVDGGAWDLSEHRGRVVVVNYWATWCPPCRVETPGLVRFANAYKDRVDMAGVSLDEDPSLIGPFVSSYGIQYPILTQADSSDASNEMMLPTTFLYDKQGRLAKKYTGMVLESTLSSDVERLLAE